MPSPSRLLLTFCGTSPAAKSRSQTALGLGERDRAREYPRRAYQIRASDLVWIGVRPVFDSIRSEAAFVGLSSQLSSRM